MQLVLDLAVLQLLISSACLLSYGGQIIVKCFLSHALKKIRVSFLLNILPYRMSQPFLWMEVFMSKVLVLLKFESKNISNNLAYIEMKSCLK